jgi:hypothetical protein
MINRREAFGGLAIVAAGLAGLTPTYAKAQDAAWSPTALSPAQAKTLEAAAEAIMPATDTPGARDAAVARTVDRWVAVFCDKTDATAIRSALDGLDAAAKAVGAASFAAASPAQQADLLAKADMQAAGARKAPFSVLKEYVTVAFFTSRPGATQTLRYDPNPGPFRGCIPASQVGRAWAT